MLKNKLYPCKECGTKVPIRSHGLCPSCRNKQRKEEGTLPTYSFKPKYKPKVKENKEELDDFFQYHLIKLQKNPKSIESGSTISNPTTANLAHLLPKRPVGGFPSVASNLDNCIYLTLQEHSNFDKLLDERNYTELEKKFPNSWDFICEKFKVLLSLCKERNKMYFSLTEYLESK